MNNKIRHHNTSKAHFLPTLNAHLALCRVLSNQNLVGFRHDVKLVRDSLVLQHTTHKESTMPNLPRAPVPPVDKRKKTHLLLQQCTTTTCSDVYSYTH